MDTKDLHGLIVPTITPRKDGRLDIEGIKKLISFLIESGVNALFILGTTGEFQYLGFEEKKKIVEVSVSENDGRIPLLVGVSTSTVEETKKLIDIANNANVDGVVLAPLYGEGAPLEKIALTIEQSEKPIMLYNNPGIHSGQNLDLVLVKKFSANNKIIGIKDSSGDKEYFGELLQMASDKFGVYQGDEATIIESLRNGAVGLVSGSSNAYPVEFKKWLAQNDEGAQAEILACIKGIIDASPRYIEGIKIKAKGRGIIETSEMFC